MKYFVIIFNMSDPSDPQHRVIDCGSDVAGGNVIKVEVKEISMTLSRKERQEIATRKGHYRNNLVT